MRCFFAIPLSSKLTKQLQMLQLGHPKVRWVALENFHITLAFLGEIDPPDMEELDQEIAELKFGGFDLTIESLGFFNDTRTARAVWAGVNENPALMDLQSKVVQVSKRVAANLDARKFKPHITLGYTQKLYLDEAAHLVEDIGKVGPFIESVQGLELWESRSTKSGAVYTSLATYPSIDEIYKEDGVYADDGAFSE